MSHWVIVVFLAQAVRRLRPVRLVGRPARPRSSSGRLAQWGRRSCDCSLGFFGEDGAPGRVRRGVSFLETSLALGEAQYAGPEGIHCCLRGSSIVHDSGVRVAEAPLEPGCRVRDDDGERAPGAEYQFDDRGRGGGDHVLLRARRPFTGAGGSGTVPGRGSSFARSPDGLVPASAPCFGGGQERGQTGASPDQDACASRCSWRSASRER